MMKLRYLSYLLIIYAILHCQLAAEVPASKVKKPDIPFLGQSFNFQTLETRIFSPYSIGMFPNRYSDLLLNPAFLVSIDKKSFYLDFNADAVETLAYNSSTVQTSGPVYDTYSVAPRWYGNTVRNDVQTAPLYNFAMLIPLSTKFSLGFFNRTLFDYGPFRSAESYQDWRENSFDFAGAYEKIEPKKIEIDENQQTVFGNQAELVLGMKLIPEIDLGLRLGHYMFNREGTLFDSKHAVYPHSSYADLNDEALDISGHHYETGLGALYHFNDRMDLGLFGTFTFGSGDESTGILDTSYNWSEQAVNTDYYSMQHAFLQSSDKTEVDTEEPELALVYQWKIKDNILFRSLLSHAWESNDFSGSNFSLDTTSSDRTYDHWIDNNTYEFRRRQTERLTRSSFSGTGEERIKTLKFFASMVYMPNQTWQLFSGLGFYRSTYDYTLEESAGYRSDSYEAYSIYNPTNSQALYRENNTYQIDLERCEWNLIIPVGLKAHLLKGLFILVGTDLTLTMRDEKAESTLFFPEKLTRRWENGILIEDTPDNDRLETFTSDPSKNFSRQVRNRFGLLYQHTSGFNVYFKSSGDILSTDNWAFGFEVLL
jgi:hypothetical protein